MARITEKDDAIMKVFENGEEIGNHLKRPFTIKLPSCPIIFHLPINRL
eukprot:UN17742